MGSGIGSRGGLVIIGVASIVSSRASSSGLSGSQLSEERVGVYTWIVVEVERGVLQSVSVLMAASVAVSSARRARPALEISRRFVTFGGTSPIKNVDRKLDFLFLLSCE